MARIADQDEAEDGLELGLAAADDALIRSEAESARLETKRLMDSVQAPVFAIDAKMQVVQWNNMCEKLTGYAKSQVLGTSVLEITAAAFREPLRALLQNALSGDESTSMQVSLIKSRAHELPEVARHVDLLLNAACNFDLNGKVVGVHCVCQDVTANRITRDSQEVLSAQLQQIVKLASRKQPNFFDATEWQFEFYPDKEEALLGEGAFGKTYKMRNKIDSQLYAVKMIKVKKMQNNGIALEALKREVHMLLQLNCPFIVRYYTCFTRKEGKYFCIVMELADGGTMTSRMVNDNKAEEGPVNESELLSYLRMMATALDHIHSKKMLHRDLKPDNVLLSNGASEVKVTDFGLACVASSERGERSRAGTLTYASPEKASSRPYGSKDDIWALGCIMSELVTGVPLAKRCAGGVMAFNQDLIARVVDDCEARSKIFGPIVRQLLSYEPEQRPSAAQVIALVDSRHQPNTSAVDELREEYQCSLCKSLVVDAVSACSEDHIFCFMCLDSALQDSKKCPTCQQEMTHPKTQVSFMVGV